MGDEGGGEAPPAAPAPTTAAPKGTTTSGADVFGNNAWLTAGAVIFYSSCALWVKLRQMAKAKGKPAKIDLEQNEGTNPGKDKPITDDKEFNELDEPGLFPIQDQKQEQVASIQSM